jgi:hypothetical protein
MRFCVVFSEKLFRLSSIVGPLALALLQSAALSVSGAEEGADSPAPARAGARLHGVHRIVFLGDSITQAGDYVTDCECRLLAHGFGVEVLNLGLGSERMAREILTAFFGARLDGVTSAEDLFPARGSEIRKLVHQRMILLFDAWMTQIGHRRPGVTGGPGPKPGPPIPEANEKAADLAKRIRLKMVDK